MWAIKQPTLGPSKQHAWPLTWSLYEKRMNTIITSIIIALFTIGFLLQFFMYKFVSSEKVKKVIEEKEASILWKRCIPPDEILSKKGLKYRKLLDATLKILIGVFIIHFALILFKEYA